MSIVSTLCCILLIDLLYLPESTLDGLGQRHTHTASEPARSWLESESASTESPRGALACFQSLPYILLIGNRAIPSSSPVGLLSGRDKAHGAFQEGSRISVPSGSKLAQILDRLAPRHNGSSELETRAGVSE